MTEAVPDVDNLVGELQLESTCEISVMSALAASEEAKVGLEFGREEGMVCCCDDAG